MNTPITAISANVKQVSRKESMSDIKVLPTVSHIMHRLLFEALAHRCLSDQRVSGQCWHATWHASSAAAQHRF